MSSSSAATPSPPSTPLDRDYQAFYKVSNGWFCGPVVKQIQKLLSLRAYAEIQTGLTTNQSTLYQKSLVSYSQNAKLLVDKQGFFGTLPWNAFMDAHVLPLLADTAGDRFTLGGLMAATMPTAAQPLNEKNGKAIRDEGKRTRALLHKYVEVWNKITINGMPPSGRNYQDVLMAVLGVVHDCNEKKKEMRKKKKEKVDDEAEDEECFEYSENPFELTPPSDYLPPSWLAFVLYGPYGVEVLEMREALPSLSDDAVVQDENRESRKSIRAESRKGAKADTKGVSEAVEAIRQISENQSRMVDAQLSISRDKMLFNERAEKALERSRAIETKKYLMEHLKSERDYHMTSGERREEISNEIRTLGHQLQKYAEESG
jgi:hypothetical protein